MPFPGPRGRPHTASEPPTPRLRRPRAVRARPPASPTSRETQIPSNKTSRNFPQGRRADASYSRRKICAVKAFASRTGAAPNLGVRRSRQTGCLAERVGLVRALPREVVVVAPEVSVRRRLRKDRPRQLEIPQDRRGTQVEMVANEVDDLLHRNVLRVERAH